MPSIATLRTFAACIVGFLLVLAGHACAIFSEERRAKASQVVEACGARVELELQREADAQVAAILADGTMSDAEARAALDALATIVKVEVLRCSVLTVAALLGPVVKPPPEHPPNATITSASSPFRVPYEHPRRARMRKRAAAYLERGAR